MSLAPQILCLITLALLPRVQPASAEPLPIRPLAKGAFSGIQEPTEQVIKDKAAFDALWTKHSARGKPAKIPEVDFTKEMVIVVTMGRQTSGGYAIHIDKVEPVGDKLRIQVSRKAPRPGSMTIQALTAPFHIVAVPRSDLKPEFVDAAADP